MSEVRRSRPIQQGLWQRPRAAQNRNWPDTRTPKMDGQARMNTQDHVDLSLGATFSLLSYNYKVHIKGSRHKTGLGDGPYAPRSRPRLHRPFFGRDLFQTLIQVLCTLKGSRQTKAGEGT